MLANSHSACVGSNACRWRTSASLTCRTRSSFAALTRCKTASVMVVSSKFRMSMFTSGGREGGLRNVSVPGPRDQFADRISFDRARIPVGVLHGEIGGLVDAVLGHADFAERWRASQLSRHVAA